MSLRGLQALTTSGEVSYVGRPLPARRTKKNERFFCFYTPMERSLKCPLSKIMCVDGFSELSSSVPVLPVIFCNSSQQLPAGASVKAANTASGLLDLSHLVLVLKVDGFCELDLQEADDLIF